MPAVVSCWKIVTILILTLFGDFTHLSLRLILMMRSAVRSDVLLIHFLGWSGHFFTQMSWELLVIRGFLCLILWVIFQIWKVWDLQQLCRAPEESRLKFAIFFSYFKSQSKNTSWPLVYYAGHDIKKQSRICHILFGTVAAKVSIPCQHCSSFITWWVLTGSALLLLLTSILNNGRWWHRHLSLVDLSLTKSIVELYFQLPLLSQLT